LYSLPSNYYQDYEFKSDEVGGAYIARIREVRNVYNICLESVNESEHLGNLGVMTRQNKQDMMERVAGYELMESCCEHCNEFWAPYKAGNTLM
jgi:hypothetical protein